MVEMHKILDEARTRAKNAWDGIARRCSSLSSATLAWGGLALAAVILLSVNLISSISLRSWQADLTQGHVFTISDGTRHVLRGIDEPIAVKVYFSKRLGELAPTQAGYFERVRALLDSYRDISGGKLQVSYLNPEPFSDAEDRAVAAGLHGVRLDAEGDLGYFGLVATNSTDNQQTIPFFTAERAAFLEYDVTKLINTLANPKKHVVGVISGLPINGGKAPISNQPTPAWMIMDQLHEFFDVRMLDEDLTKVPSDVDVLMLVQPKALTPKAAYAIDQYVLGGGRALVFADPMPEAAYLQTLGKGSGGMEQLAKLLKSWGIGFVENKVATDIEHARRVQFGQSGGTVTDYVAWLALDDRNIDKGDVLSAGIDTLNFASPGFLQRIPGAGATVTPLLHTGPQAMEVDASKVGPGADPVALLRNYKPRGTPLVLAARVRGEAQSAFPDGPPTDAKANDKKADDKKAEDKSDKTGLKADAAKADAAASPSPGAAPTVAKTAKNEPTHIASGKVNAIVIADTDLMADQFWVDRRELLGQQVVVPTSQNAAFVVGALENLSGDDALISLRARGVTDRPFTLVEDLRRNAERKFREKEQALTQRLQNLQQGLNKLESAQGGGAVLLSEEERAAADKFRADMLNTRRQLRDVKLALRRDIDRLDGWLKFANIGLVPLAIGFGGLGWSLWRTRRRKGGKR
jgi:gliding motility-associatede transport system auxiliary component